MTPTASQDPPIPQGGGGLMLWPWPWQGGWGGGPGTWNIYSLVYQAPIKTQANQANQRDPSTLPRGAWKVSFSFIDVAIGTFSHLEGKGWGFSPQIRSTNWNFLKGARVKAFGYDFLQICIICCSALEGNRMEIDGNRWKWYPLLAK